MSARAVSSFFFHPSFLLVRSFIYLPALLREDYPVPAGEISIPSGIGISKQRPSASSLSRLELVKISYPHLAGNEDEPMSVSSIFRRENLGFFV